MNEFFAIIGGKKQSVAKTFPVINPATGTMFASAPDCPEQLLEDAIQVSQATPAAWKKDEQLRRGAIYDCGKILDENKDELAALLTLEQGKPLAEAHGEIQIAAKQLYAAAELELPNETLLEDKHRRTRLMATPLGIVGIITPWNFPVSIATRKLGPALLAGNTAIIKPSPFTPLATLRLGELFADALPKGVLSVISGLDPLGQLLVADSRIPKISFTGSTRTGRHIMATGAAHVKRVTLELGGNDAAIVLGDVNPQETAKKLCASAFRNAGQVCIAIKRVYAEASVYQPLLEAMVKIAEDLIVGPGDQPGVQMGPINNKPQYDRVLALIASARQDSRVLAGGSAVDRPGYFVQPTIIADCPENSRVVQEEQFGPVLPVISVASAEEGIQRSNTGEFALGGSIWTNHRDKGAKLAEQMDCGTVWVNAHGELHPKVPFGGAGISGIGYENGRLGLEAFCQMKVVDERFG